MTARLQSPVGAVFLGVLKRSVTTPRGGLAGLTAPAAGAGKTRRGRRGVWLRPWRVGAGAPGSSGLRIPRGRAGAYKRPAAGPKCGYCHPAAGAKDPGLEAGVHASEVPPVGLEPTTR